MGDESAVEPVIGVECRSRATDRAIRALAERQHGVVARGQLLALGVGRRAIEHRVACARLLPLHRGVYAVGHRHLTKEGRWMAAVLAGGAGAVLSHRSAAALWGMRPETVGRPEVTVAGAAQSRRSLHVSRARLSPDEVTLQSGIPVTTPPRTLLDLAAVVRRHQLERAFREAEFLRLADALSVDTLLARSPHRRGSAAVRAILADKAIGATVTRSELEDRFLSFVDDFGLPRPTMTNALVDLARGGQVEADCVWRREGVIVELDGRASHATATGFERDRARDRALQAAGWRVIRITWRQLHDDPAAVAGDLAALLSSPAAVGRR